MRWRKEREKDRKRGRGERGKEKEKRRDAFASKEKKDDFLTYSESRVIAHKGATEDEIESLTGSCEKLVSKSKSFPRFFGVPQKCIEGKGVA